MHKLVLRNCEITLIITLVYPGDYPGYYPVLPKNHQGNDQGFVCQLVNTQGITQGIQPVIHQGNHFTNIGHMTNHITYLSSNDQFPMITQGITQGNPIFTRVLPRVIHCSLPPIHQGNDQLTYHYITNYWYYRILIIHQGIHQGNDQGKRQGNDQGNIAVAWDSDDF